MDKLKDWDAPMGVKVVAFSLVAVFVAYLLMAIYIFILWVRYSLIRNKNSQNLTGRDLTEKIFAKNGMKETEIKRSIMYAKYWNHNKRKNTYRLRWWTHDRRSIWTMMEATQQAYATVTRETNKKAFWTAFRLPNFIGIAGAVVAAGIAGYTISKTPLDDFETKQWVSLTIAMTTLFLAQAYSLAARQYFLKKNALNFIKDIGFTEQELKMIQRIWVTLFWFAVLSAILETIKLILQLLAKASEHSNALDWLT